MARPIICIADQYAGRSLCIIALERLDLHAACGFAYPNVLHALVAPVVAEVTAAACFG